MEGFQSTSYTIKPKKPHRSITQRRKNMTINLFRHNEEAYEKVVSLLNKYNKAAVIHPTGSGKSFIAFKLADDNKDKRFLWASPSEYIFRTQVQNLRREYPEVSVDNIEFFTYAKLMVMEESEIQNIKPDFFC